MRNGKQDEFYVEPSRTTTCHRKISTADKEESVMWTNLKRTQADVPFKVERKFKLLNIGTLSNF